MPVALRLISHKALFDKKAKLYLTVNNKTIDKGHWDVPMTSNLTDNIRKYCRDYDINIDVPMTIIKEFLDTYKKGLFIERKDGSIKI